MVRFYNKRKYMSPSTKSDTKLAKARERQRRYRLRKLAGLGDGVADEAGGTLQKSLSDVGPFGEGQSRPRARRQLSMPAGTDQLLDLAGDAGDIPCTPTAFCGKSDEWLFGEDAVEDVFEDQPAQMDRTLSTDPLDFTLSVPGSYRETEDVFPSFSVSTDPLDRTLSPPEVYVETQDAILPGNSSRDPLDDTISVPNSPHQVVDALLSRNPSSGDPDPGPNHDFMDEGSSSASEEENFVPTVQWLAGEISRIRLSSNVSDQAIEKLFKFFMTRHEDILQLRSRGKITDSYLSSIKPHALKSLPSIWCAIKVRELRSPPEDTRGRNEDEPEDNVFELRDLRRIPNEYVRPSTDKPYVIVSQEAHVKLCDIKQHFEATHPALSAGELRDIYRNARLSVDGIKESSKGARKLIMVTLMFGSCILPWRVLNPLKGDKDAPKNAEAILRLLVDEVLADDEIRIVQVLADKVERNTLKCLPGVTGKFSCEHCVCPGKGLSGGWPYPFSTRFPPRDHAGFERTARQLQGRDPSEVIDRAETQGILACTPLLDLPEFDIINGMPLDEFHLVREGLAKLMLERIFIKSSSVEAKAIFKKCNRAVITMRVFSQSPRRTRTLERIPDYKGNEWGLMVLTVMPFIFKFGIRSKESTWLFKRKAMAIFTFLVRTYFHDDNILRKVEEKLAERDATLRGLHRGFYKYFQEGFTKPYAKAIPPNGHCFWHLEESRKSSGPLQQTSTEPFEALYAVIRRSFKAGTPNTPKQIMENFYLRDLKMHRCRANGFGIISKDTGSSKYADNLIRLKNDQVWEVQEVLPDGRFRCHLVVTCKFTTSDIGLRLPWNLVGISKFIRVDPAEEDTFTAEDIKAKVMRCKKILADWMPGWMTDSKIDL